MPNIGPLELIIVLVIALLVLGPGKLPEVGASLGKSIREFRKASSDIADSVKVDVDTSPVPTTPAAVAPVSPVAPAPVAPAPVIAPAAVDPAPAGVTPATTPSDSSTVVS
ncbi:MAG: sec-independent protein translocase protein TatA [Chloroflexota bacterium]|nr:sec-independent protein translocase protein TatA [Chloroflexota bacterium]